MLIRESEFPERISKYKNILYLCHRNADPDAIGSGFALQQAFGGTLGAVEDLSRSGQAVAKAIGAMVSINPNVEDYDLVVLVDASVRLQIGNFSLKSYAVVDHHLDKGLLPDAVFYIQRPSNSTAEIVWAILKEGGIKVTGDMALGLLIGIISDTGRFRRAKPEALRAAAELIEGGELDYEEVLQVISLPQVISQKMAVLKAVTRAKIGRAGDWIIATTEINAYEGSAAMALVDLGADVAFVAGRHGDVTRVSARAGRDAARKGLNLAEILRDLGESHGGEGGGHKAAAALETRGEPTLLLDECRKRASAALL